MRRVLIVNLPRRGRLPNVGGRGCLGAGVSGSVHGEALKITAIWAVGRLPT